MASIPLTNRAAIQSSLRADLARDVQFRCGRAFRGYNTVIATEVIEAASAMVANELGDNLAIFARAMATKMARDRPRVATIHRTAAILAQRSVVNSYKGSRNKARRDTLGISATGGDPALAGNRYARGAMLKALSSSGFFIARYDGVSFINAANLDRAARQWYRLNFGAGAKGANTRRPGEYTMRFFGQPTLPLSLNRFGPSPAYRMPPGLWTHNDGRSAPGSPIQGAQGTHFFMPSSSYDKRLYPVYDARLSRGFRGMNFLDAGIRTLSQEIPKGWTQLMLEWFKESAELGKGPVAFFLDQDDSARAFQYLQQEAKALDSIVALAGSRL